MDENTKWYPLEAFCRKHFGDVTGGLVDCRDMMFMGVQLGVWSYKHRNTRRYLHLLCNGNLPDSSEHATPSAAIEYLLD